MKVLLILLTLTLANCAILEPQRPAKPTHRVEWDVDLSDPKQRNQWAIDADECHKSGETNVLSGMYRRSEYDKAVGDCMIMRGWNLKQVAVN